MTIRDRRELKQTAQRRLDVASYKPGRLILIHSGVALGASLLLAIFTYIMDWQIQTNGSGLAGMELRTILETASLVLQGAVTILAPFWTIGLSYAVLRIARGKAAWPHTLLEGFRRKGPVLRLLLMQGLIYGIITFAAIYGAYFLYSMTPDGTAFTEAILKLYFSGEFATYREMFEQIPEPVLEQVARVYVPILCSVLLVLMIPASYRLRMASFALMDEEGTGAWKAIRTSFRITRRNCFKLFLLDLSYWWYYLLAALLTVPLYADVLLPALNITLSVDSSVIALIGAAVYVVLTLILESLAKPGIMTTYALAYDVLKEQHDRASSPQQSRQVVDSYGYRVKDEE